MKMTRRRLKGTQSVGKLRVGEVCTSYLGRCSGEKTNRSEEKKLIPAHCSSLELRYWTSHQKVMFFPFLSASGENVVCQILFLITAKVKQGAYPNHAGLGLGLEAVLG